MTTIKAIIFDVGGVLRFETDGAIQRDIQQTLGIAPENFTEPWQQLTDQLGRGVITEAEFWPQLHALTKATQPVPAESLLMREFQKGYRLNEEVLALAKQLRAMGYSTAILSNSIASHADFHRTHGTYDGFEPVILSHEVGLTKPSSEIFTHTLKALKTIPPEAVLVDDKQKNITGAQALGMHAILFKDTAQLEQDLRHLGITI